MTDFIDLNLWMFFVIGVLGYMLCFFRYKFVWWIVPFVALLCYGYLGELPSHIQSEFKTITLFRIGFSMFAAVALPVAGALADHRHRNPQRKLLP